MNCRIDSGNLQEPPTIDTTLVCRPYVARVVWDGDSELYEIQQPDYAGENDTALVAGDRPYWGRVMYTHGKDMDQPLAVTRMGYAYNSYNGGTYDRFTIHPFYDYKGLAVDGAFEDGLKYHCNDQTNYTNCVQIKWQSASSAFGLPSVNDGIKDGWMGSVIWNKIDVTGKAYRRNRYYDPETGRFTQEDPIGLAGGINAYGFASGDPVNYSDPFGLTAMETGDEAAAADSSSGPSVTVLGVDITFTPTQTCKSDARQAAASIGIAALGLGLGSVATTTLRAAYKGVVSEQAAARLIRGGLYAGPVYALNQTFNQGNGGTQQMFQNPNAQRAWNAVKLVAGAITDPIEALTSCFDYSFAAKGSIW
jgi:RHS repeat-associated protein